MSNEDISAAQYIRMSTDHQQFSTKNQSDVILEYAQKHGYKIIKSYVDEGKSGLKIKGREKLQSLMKM